MTNTYTQSVACAVRAEMARQGITQRALSAKLGWSQQMLSTRLTSQIAFTTDEIETISKHLGIEVGELASPVQR